MPHRYDRELESAAFVVLSRSVGMDDTTTQEDQWPALYAAWQRQTLDCAFIRRIVSAWYGGLYVDEYQDCSRPQHDIVLKLARDIPCRILGDPLQGIFDFDGQPIDWESDVAARFERIGQLDTPHRWENAGVPALGAWLRDIRLALEQWQPIDLVAARNKIAVQLTDADPARLLIAQGNACRGFKCEPRDTVIAIHKGEPTYKARCHKLAKQLKGAYSSIEEIEGRELFSFVRGIHSAKTDRARMKLAVALAKKAMSGVNDAMPAGTAADGEHMDIRANTRNPHIAKAGNGYLFRPTSDNMAALLLAIKETAGVHLARADLFNRAVGVLKKQSVNPQLTLPEAAEKYQTRFRYRGPTSGAPQADRHHAASQGARVYPCDRSRRRVAVAQGAICGA